MKIATVMPIGEARADLPANLFIPESNANAALLLIEALADRSQDEAEFRWTKPLRLRGGKRRIQVRFRCYHDAVIVQKFINDNYIA